MPTYRDLARAKVNLTLTVHGRRSDGYHHLSSLVAFADIGDHITLETDAAPGLRTIGEQAGAIAGANILHTTLDLLARTAPSLRLGCITLDKCLPVAAGIGGGSSDCAALLRLVRTANPDQTSTIDWRGLARQLGADVPVCLHNRSCWMTGTGARLHDLANPLPALDAVLVNPMTAVSADKTTRVFALLNAPALREGSEDAPVALAGYRDRDDLLELMRRLGNDLEAPACAAVPQIMDVFDALETLDGVQVIQLSGAGPTCFAIFAGREAALEAARRVAAEHPDWWVRATTLS
jgi:4-diphosphocytidyl-2-C-methyl-D-erythritol kinase